MEDSDDIPTTGKMVRPPALRPPQRRGRRPGRGRISSHHRRRERDTIGPVPWGRHPTTERGKIGRRLPTCSVCTSLLHVDLSGAPVTDDFHTSIATNMADAGRWRCVPRTEFGRFARRKRQFIRQNPVSRVVSTDTPITPTNCQWYWRYPRPTGPGLIGDDPEPCIIQIRSFRPTKIAV